ncbi:MAG: hypothetical protein U0232_19200, partial [Thermomicrobiales bacterium]
KVNGSFFASHVAVHHHVVAHRSPGRYIRPSFRCSTSRSGALLARTIHHLFTNDNGRRNLAS